MAQLQQFPGSWSKAQGGAQSGPPLWQRLYFLPPPPPEVPVKQKIPGLGAGNPASLLSLLEPPAVPVLFQHLTDGELTFLRVPSSS